MNARTCKHKTQIHIEKNTITKVIQSKKYRNIAYNRVAKTQL